MTLGAGYARFRFDQVHKVTLAHLRQAPSAGSPPLAAENILIVGNNTRIGQHEGFFGTVQQDGGARSDVTMVLHLDPARRTASLLSIPRDLYVPLPAGSMSGPEGKIDASLNDGPDNLVNAVSSELGIPIDHYVEVDFDGFQNVINAIGGIQMYFPMPLRDAESGLNVTQPGCQLLNGAQALAVVRARHLEYFTNGKWNADPYSDLSRIRRDQLFLRVLVHTIKQKGLNNPIRAQATLSSIVNDITIDSGFSESDLFNLGLVYRHINPSAVPALTLPITVVNNYGPYGDVDFPSEPQDQQVIAKFLGTSAPAPAPGPVLEIQDISGIAWWGTRIGQALSAVGFNVGKVTARPAVRAPSESVIDYAPGQLAQASGLLNALSGAVVTYPDPSVPAGTLILQSGSVLAVTPPAPQASNGGASPPAAPGASPTPVASPTVPTPGGEAITPSVFPPQAYDPSACPASAP